MGLFDSVSDTINTQAERFSSIAANAIGGGNSASALAGRVSSMGANAARGLVNNIVPVGIQRDINLGAAMVGDIQSGNLDGALSKLMGSGYLDGLIHGASGEMQKQRYWNTVTPVMGGVTPKEAKQIHDALRGQGLAKKELWMIEVSSELEGKDASSPINILATELDYSPMTVSGDKRKIGASTADGVQSSEPIELRITAMDTKAGFIKKWFEKHYNAVVATNGTVGLPGNYAIKIRIVHAFISDGSNHGGFEVTCLYRPANIEISLSRREDAIHEVSMTFQQLDTFMRP